MPNIEVSGQVFEVELTDRFSFCVMMGENPVIASTIEELKTRISQRLKAEKQEYDIQVVIFYNGLYRRAVLRGQNTRSRAALLTVDGEKVSIDNPKFLNLSADISDEQLAEVNRLYAVAKAAKDCFEKYREAVGMGRYLTVSNLLEKA